MRLPCSKGRGGRECIFRASLRMELISAALRCSRSSSERGIRSLYERIREFCFRRNEDGAVFVKKLVTPTPPREARVGDPGLGNFHPITRKVKSPRAGDPGLVIW